MGKRALRTTDFLTWEEINGALRRLGEIDIAIGRIEGNVTLQINEIKAKADIEAEALLTERKTIEQKIETYCQTHKDEFAKKRSRELTFGTVAFKVTTRIVVKAAKACVAAMEALGLDTYLKVKKSPDKEKMLGLDDQTLAKIGAYKRTADKLRIEPNIEKIREAS